jgi:hypothetical protein
MVAQEISGREVAALRGGESHLEVHDLLQL